jgi:DNA-binding transcriptional regulator YdaS (Cro superfamily)
MDHKQLLKDLGGEHAVHAALEARHIAITPVAVRAWALGARSIPAKYWAHIADIASGLGKTVSFEELAESVKAEPRLPRKAAA